MPVKVSFKTGLLEFFNLICLLVVVLVIPIATAVAFQAVDQNTMQGKSVLGVSEDATNKVDPTKDNTATLTNVSEKLSTINDNSVSTKILIAIGAALFAVTIFLVVTLVSSVYKKPSKEKIQKSDKILFSSEP
ncbi:MAG: hypothetical protein WCO33_00570 [bacterium]